MSQTSSTIKLIFDGSAAGVTRAAAQARKALKGLDDDNSKLNKTVDKLTPSLQQVGKAVAYLGAASSAVPTIGGLAGALGQLAPAALLLPGALLGGAAAMGTFKIATAGMGDALKAGLSGDMEKFAEATKDMAPEMQNAAKAVSAFKPQIDDLKKTVQGNFWAGFSADITKLGNTYLPIFKAGMGGIASEFNIAGKQAFTFLQSAQAIGSINNILNKTRDAFGSMRGVLTNVVSGFLQLANVGANFLPRLSAEIQTASEKFAAWAKSIAASGQLEDMINGAIQGFKDLGGIVGNVGSILGSVFTGLGGVVESPLAKIRELTAQVAEFMKTAAAQDGLRALGETLQVVGDVVGKVVLTAFRELAPTLVKLAPVAQEVARTLGDLLVSALETLGPLIRGVADVFNAFPGSAGAATTAVVGFVAAVKAIKAVNAVTDLLGLQRAFGGVSAAAGEAGKTAGITWGKGFVGTLGLIGVGVAGTVLLDKILPKDAAVTHGSQAARDMLGEMAKVFSGEQGNIFRTWDVAKWISNPIAMAVEVGSRELQKLFQVANSAIPPINFNVNTGPAQSQVVDFMNRLKGLTGEININGRTESAAQALADIIQAINQGQGTVILNGQPVPVQDALKQVIDLINSSVGLVNVNGDFKLAGDALAAWLTKANSSTATPTLNADGAPAYETVGGWTRLAEGTVGMAALNANPAGANTQLGGWKGRAEATTGTAGLNANPAQANAQTSGWQGRANSTTGTSKLNADPGQANGQTSGWQGRANSTTGMAKLDANTSAATSAVNAWKAWASGIVVTVKAVLQKIGFANGGPVLAGFAGGGAISGRGTGTSDSIPAMLSHGEHVLTAREVAAAGGHAAIFALRRSLSKGQVPRMYATGGRAATGGAVSGASAFSIPTPQVAVSVHIGNQEITDIVRTQIATSNRQTRRTVGMGAGTTF
jgi:hypothetical protein